MIKKNKWTLEKERKEELKKREEEGIEKLMGLYDEFNGMLLMEEAEEASNDPKYWMSEEGNRRIEETIDKAFRKREKNRPEDKGDNT